MESASRFTRILSTVVVAVVLLASSIIVSESAPADHVADTQQRLGNQRTINKATVGQEFSWERADEPSFSVKVRGPREPRATTRYVSDCMHVTSEPGRFVFKATSEDRMVCGIFFLTDPDHVVELRFTHFDVPCDGDSLVSFVDGWELNGQVFPSAADHPLPLEQRSVEFCGSRVTRVFLSAQNAALIQYRIPQRGRGFTVFARYPKNPTPCNVLVDSTSDLFTLRNYGRSVNCTLSAMYPAAVRTIALDVGTGDPFGIGRAVETGTVRECEKRGLGDFVEIGGSEGLDSSALSILESICGFNSKPEDTENVVGCGVTSVRLVSSGSYENSVTVAVRPATDDDISSVDLVCGM